MTVSRVLSPALLVVVSLLAAPLSRGDRFSAPEVRHDRPGEAMAFRSLSLRGDLGEIPPDGLMRAHRQAAAMQERLATEAAMDADGSFATLAAPLTRSGWTWIGPGNIGGRVRALVVHPTATNTMFAGSVSGGIWKTIDAGASWAPVDDFMANLAVTSIVFDPADPRIMYAATGEGFSNADAIRGAGIFKSIDSGTTWRQLASTNVPSFHYVLRLAISADGRVLLAGTTAGLFRSADGGTTWTRRTSAPPAFDVDFHPRDSRRAVLGDRAGRVWHTVDGGLTWTRALLSLPATATGSSRVEVAYAKGTPDVVYAVVDRDDGLVFRSVDGGASFVQTFHSDYVRLLENGQGWYDLALWVNPFDANDLLVGGVNLYRSRDGGQTFTLVSTLGTLHADLHVIVEHPRFDNVTRRTLFIGNDGGVYRVRDLATLTSSSSAGYEELNNNLGVTQFYGAAGNPTTGVIVGGTQDNGTLVYDPASGSEGWDAMFGGDGGVSAADPTNSNYFYGEYIYLQLHRSTNGGRTSNFIYSGLGDAGRRANFIAPFVLDPNAPRRLLAGGQSLWRTDDARASAPAWRAIKQGTAGNYISAIAVAPGNSNLIWVGHNNGDLYRTTNGTASSPAWTKMDPTSLPNRFVTRITIDPFDQNVVYAAFGGFSNGNIQRSDNGGVTWVDATGTSTTGLPLAPVRDVEVDPTDSNAIWAGTEVGIFTSRDRGATWDATHDGPANVSVDELFVMGDHLYAVTHGRGIFRHALVESGEPPPTPPLPSPWLTADIGAVGVAGGASYSNGTFTVRGAGADVWGTSDAFRFVYRPLSGDGEIVARVASVQNVAAWVKAGVMIRQNTGAGSPHAFMLVSAGRGLAFQRRATAGGTTTSTAAGSGTAPRWVRLSRRGQVVTASHSVNGTSWTTVGQSTIALSGTVLVGLAVSSHDATRTATATFDNVSVTPATSGTLPSGWTSRDVGAVGVAGSASGSGASFTVRGAGADIWGTADAFQFAYRTLAGDGTIVARVASVSAVHDWTKAGIMLRAGTGAGAAHAIMLVSAGRGLAFQRRSAAGGITTHTAGGTGTAPRWLRLVRTGDRVTASASADGRAWTTVGSATIALPSTALVGLAISSHDPARLATAVFDQVTVTVP